MTSSKASHGYGRTRRAASGLFVPRKALPPALRPLDRPTVKAGFTGLVAGLVACVGPSGPRAAAAAPLNVSGPALPAPGTIFVANAGADGNGSVGTGPGSITLYRPGATGDARPEAVVTKGVDGPGSVTFDTMGDLWVANQTGTIVEYSRAGLAKASRGPSVTPVLHGRGPVL